MEYKKIKFDIKDKIGFITLDSIKTFNALDDEIAAEILDSLTKAEASDEVNVVIIKGGDKAFSAGGNISEFKTELDSGNELKFEIAHTLFDITDYIRSMSKIVIAEVAGVAAGAGASLAFAVDFVMAARDAKFILAFANMGLTPDMGGLYMLVKDIGWHRTLNYSVTADPMAADELKEMGVVYQTYDKSELASKTLDFAKKLANGPVLSYRNSKRLVYETSFKDFKDFHTAEYASSLELVNTKDFREAVEAFLEKRNPEFKGE